MQFREKDFILRTPQSYDYHCSLLSGPLAEQDSVTYGVNFRSPLNDLKYFHVANFQLPQDIMHVMLEGVIPYEMKLMLGQFINNEHYFTLSVLNDRILCFPYSPEEISEKPPPIKAEHLKAGNKSKFQHSGLCAIRNIIASFNLFTYVAAQMWTLARYLPLIIGNKVPTNNQLWDCYLMLLDILEICTARVLSVGLVNYLSALIEDHHVMFKRCYPGSSVIPKMHYMTHFPTQILK